MANSYQREEETKPVERYRHFRGYWGWVFSATAIAFTILYLTDLAGFFDDPAHYISPFQFLYFVVALSAIYSLCYIPGTKNAPRDRLTWYDIVLIVAIIPTTVYLWINWYELKFSVIGLSTYQVALMVPTLIAFLEAVRRVVGWILPFIGILAIIYIFVSPYLPGVLESRPHTFSSVIEALFIGEEGIYGNVMNLIVFVISIVFIFGGFLRVLGGERYFTDFAAALAGRQSGGAAKVAVIGSGLFGMLSGSGVANVAVTGQITIPMMKQSGQRAEFAGGVEAVASTGGTFMPPVMGAIAFLMADFLGMSYWSVCIHAFIPAMLYYFILFLQVHQESVRKGIMPVPGEDMVSPLGVMKKGWTIIIPIVVLVYFLAVKGWSVQTAFLYATAVLVVVSCIYKETRPMPRRFVRALEEGGRAVLTFIPLIIVVGVILTSINITGLGVRLTHTLTIIGAANPFLLIVVAIAGAFIMGMAVSGIATYILLGIFIAPIVVGALNVEPMAVHLFLMYIASTSMITPPVCLAVYVACSIAHSKLWPTGLEAVRLGLGMYILPFIFLVNPAVMLFGGPFEVVRAVASGAVACVCLATGAMGYFFFTKINFVYRIALFLSGIAVMFPWIQVQLIAGGVIIASITGIVLPWWRARSASQISGGSN